MKFNKGDARSFGDAMHSLSRKYFEVVALNVVEDGSDGPGDADAEEDVDGVGAGDVTDGGVSVGVLLGSHLGGEGVWGQEMSQQRVQNKRIYFKAYA